MTIIDYLSALPNNVTVIITNGKTTLYKGDIKTAYATIPDICLRTTVEKGYPMFIQDNYTYIIQLPTSWKG